MSGTSPRTLDEARRLFANPEPDPEPRAFDVTRVEISVDGVKLEAGFTTIGPLEEKMAGRASAEAEAKAEDGEPIGKAVLDRMLERLESEERAKPKPSEGASIDLGSAPDWIAQDPRGHAQSWDMELLAARLASNGSMPHDESESMRSAMRDARERPVEEPDRALLDGLVGIYIGGMKEYHCRALVKTAVDEWRDSADPF